MIEEALQQSSSMRIYQDVLDVTESQVHRQCIPFMAKLPQQEDKDVWENFRRIYRPSEERKQARQAQNRNQGRQQLR
jgi:hypothetical protein